ncbi:Sigma-54-dependent Fis family transcriptional regulator [Sulfidibacter corallicola]
MSPTILIVEDEDTLRQSLQRVLRREGYQVDSAATAEEGLALCRATRYHLIISDINLPGMDGIEMLARIRAMDADAIFIITTAYGALDSAIGALRAGAYDYLLKPVKHDALRRLVRTALAGTADNRSDAPTPDGFDGMIGIDGGLRHMAAELRMVARSASSNLLLLGETGTGKGFLARAIHAASARATKPFMAINCGAVPEHLIESEMFGHVKGAFTGAVSDKTGLFVAADGGTLFLDEIGDMPLAMQVKLLKVLEDGEVRPLGGTRGRKVDIRVISATNKDLTQAIAAGTFRQDLYYRINLFTMSIPPLRDRREDIPALVAHYLARHESGKTMSAEALAKLQAHGWPGNIRELQNVVERCALISQGEEIEESDLPTALRAGMNPIDAQDRGALSIEAYTKKVILEHQDRLSETELAKMLGITRKTLWEKRRKWGLLR